MNRIVRTAIVAFAAAALAACSGPGYRLGTVSQQFHNQDGQLDAGGRDQLLQDSGYLTTPDGVRLYYRSRGAGHPVLVVHGGPGLPPTDTWPAADALADRYRFIYYHQRGSGLSDRPIDRFATSGWRDNLPTLTSALGIEAQIADIEHLRAAIGVERVTLLGHSYGGFIASLYAAEFPGRVERLVLIAPASVVRMPNDESNLFVRIAESLPPDQHQAFDTWLERSFDYRGLWEQSESELVDLNNELAPFFYHAIAQAARVAEVEPWGQPSDHDPSLTGGWIQPAIYLSLGRRYDLRPALAAVQAPTQVFVGDADLASGPDSVADYVETIPDARLTVLRGAGHAPQYDAQRFTAQLAAALGRR